MKTILLIFTALLNTALVFAQKSMDHKIVQFDSLLVAGFEIIEGITPSISVAIVSGSDVVYSKALGYANLEQELPATVDTKYYIASITKSYTGLLASKLHHVGKINLDKSITTYLNDGFKDESIKNNPVNVRSLLTHTSGLINDPLTTRAAFTGASDSKSMTNCLYNYTSLNDKTGKYSYDNLGYNIFNQILEHELGKNWKELLHSEVLDPLGLDNTTAYIPSIISESVALPYMLGINGCDPVYLHKQNNTMHAAGGIYSTPEDLGKWMIYNMGTKKSSIPKEVFNLVTSTLVAVDSVKRSAEPYNMEGYGLGWKTGTYKNNKIIYHSGSFAGYLSQASFMPEKQLGIAVFVNESMLGGELSRLLLGTFYDIFNASMDVEHVRNTFNKMEIMNNSMPDRIKNYRTQLKQRVWQLSLSMKNYAGTYINDAYGEMNIVNKNETLLANFGNTHSILTAYKTQDGSRAEFVPLSGEVIQFKVIDEKVEALVYGGFEFIKK